MLSIGWNTKLRKGKIGVFNLPADKKICGRVCPACYALKAQIYPTVTAFRYRNYRASRGQDFVSRLSAELRDNQSKIRALRVHESGDFYNQDYINKWVDIARAFPAVKFYAYTKRKRELDFRRMLRLKNFVLIDSLKYGINYGGPDVVNRYLKHKAFLCPAVTHRVTCGAGCDYCLTKDAQSTGVVFQKH